MKKSFVVMHTMNKSFEGFMFAEPIAVYDSEENAKKRIKEVTDEIVSGKSAYFPNFIPTIEKYGVTNCYGITCKWTADDLTTTFTHIYIQEVKKMD